MNAPRFKAPIFLSGLPSRRLFWIALVGVWGLTALLLALTNAIPVIQPLVVFGFLLLVPGLVFVRLLNSVNLWVMLTLSIAVSLAIVTAVSTALLYAGLWSIPLGMGIILVISLIGSLLAGPARPAALRETGKA
jgi:hypothetical protein